MAFKISDRNLSNHETVLLVDVRCKAFHIGAGTGILSIFSAQAGAKQVYAVEQSPVAQCAKEIIAASGSSDQITVFQAQMEKLEIPEKVDARKSIGDFQKRELSF